MIYDEIVQVYTLNQNNDVERMILVFLIDEIIPSETFFAKKLFCPSKQFALKL